MFFIVGFPESLLGIATKLIGPLVGLALGWAWGKWQAGNAWKSKEFRSLMVLGLNVIELREEAGEGQPVTALKLRTLFERQLEDVMTNRAMRSKVKDAIAETKEGDPILRFPKEDAWFMLNTVLNQIAEQFAEGTLRADMGADVQRRWYTFCLTFEHEKKMHQFKTRVQIMDKERFLAFPDEGEIELETFKHQVRVDTLRVLKKEYKENPHLFMDIELAL